MSITPNLKPDEFEVTILCPVGACRVQSTFAFHKDLLKEPNASMVEAKRRINQMSIDAHKEGKHNGRQI